MCYIWLQLQPLHSRSVGWMRLERSLLLSLLLFQMFAWCYTPWNCILSDCVKVHWKPEMRLFFLDFALWKGWYSQLNLSLMTLMCVSETLRKLSSCVPRYIHHLGRLSQNIRFLQIVWDITHEVFCWIRKCVSLKTGLKPILESINHKIFYLTVFHMASVCNTWWNCPAKYLQKHKSVHVFWFPAIWIYIIYI